MADEYEWEGDWYSVESATEAKWAEDELYSEICPGHVLYGRRASPIGRRWRRDDFLFLLDDGRFARVHLTRRPETDPSWPDTEIFETFQDWQALPLEDR